MIFFSRTPHWKARPPGLHLIRCSVFLFSLFAFLSAALAVESPVPATKFSTPPAMDGSPQSWSSAPGQVISNPDGKATFQLGYDDENFYARIQVVDESPLKNSSPLPQEMLKGGDAVALYFGNDETDGQRVLFAHWQDRDIVWLYRPKSTEKRPYTFASPAGEETFDFVGPMKSAQVFSQLVPEGYVVELALPWKALGLSPTARIPFDLQIIFSDPSGSTNVGGVWWHSNNGANYTTEDLPSEARLEPGGWGEVQLEGLAPAATPAPATKESTPAPESTPAGQTPVAPTATRSGDAKPGAAITFDVPRDGRVTVLILDEKGWIIRELITAEKHEAGPLTVEWDGRDRYHEPLPPGNYTWKALVFDSMGSRFLGSVGNSGRPPYRTPDNLGSLGGQHGVMKSVGQDGRGVILAGATEEGPAAIRKVNPETVEAVWKRAVGFVHAVLALTSDSQRTVMLLRGGKGKTDEVELVILDPMTGLSEGKMKERYKVNVPPKPESDKVGLALVGDKVVFSVVGENRLGGVDLKTGENLPDIEFPSPRGLYALDEKNLLVCSKDKVLSLNIETGQISPFLSGLSDAGAVCLDSSGNIYVSDLGASQQIKKFDRNRKLVATFGKLGGKPPHMDPYDPLAFDNVVDMVVGPDGNLWLAEVSKIPNRVIRMTTDGQWLEDICGPIAYNSFGPDLDDPSIVYYNMGGDPRFVQTKVDYDAYAKNPMDPANGWKITAIHDFGLGADGKTPNELMADVAKNAYGHVIAFTAHNGHRYFFRMSKGNRASSPPGAGLWIWRSDRWVPTAFLSANEDPKKGRPSWQDANGDGLMQEDERFTGLPTSTFSWIDRDLVLNGFDGTIAPVAVSDSGTPDYRGGKYHPYLKEGAPDYREGWTFVSPVADGAVYYVSNPGPERKLTHWDTAHENRLIKVKDGRTEWVIGEHNERPVLTEFTTASGVAGIVDDIVIAHNVEPASYIAFTTDGFALGNAIVDEEGQQPKIGPTAITVESFTGLFIKDPKTGRRMLFSVVSGDDRILEITGPGELTRLNGSAPLAAPIPLGEVTKPMVIPHIGWRGRNSRVSSVDAVEAEWPAEKEGYSWMENGREVGDLRLRRDEGALQLFASALQTTPFGQGDAVELSFAAEDGNQKMDFVLTGFFNDDGKFIGEGFEVVNGERRKIDDIKVMVKPRWHQLGWRMEARLPLELLGNLSITSPQIVRRIEKEPKSGRMIVVGKPTSEEVADLPAKFQFQATLASHREGTLRRTSLPADQLSPAEAP